MKINAFLLLIAVAISGFIFYGFYSATSGALLVSLLSGGVSLITLSSAMAISVKGTPRSTTMFKTASITIFVLMIIINTLFAYLDVEKSVLIVTNGVIICLWAAILYLIGRSKQ